MPDQDLRANEVTVPLPDRGFDAGLWFIGRLRTPWATRSDCPRRGDPADGPICRIELDRLWEPALLGLEGREQVQLLYWMDRSRRDLVQQSPRHDGRTTGTFALRSPVRPNPIAASVVRLLEIDGPVLRVRGLDCIDGTPLLDIKPVFACHL